MVSAIVVEDHPLIALGLQQILENTSGVEQVQLIEPSAIVDIAHSLAPVLVVYGMSDQSTHNCDLLRRLHKRLPNAAILLLSDNIWTGMPDGCGVVDHLPKTASIDRIEAAIARALPLPGRDRQAARRCGAAAPVYPSTCRGMLRFA
ncbi:DNA-binding response regulator [Cupriavidus sp. AU9028]|uniref:DNA-binding response regulator n=1 Tax=Cupriavidus sp. AU9028 TaxID=2871157 RepID=UPI001C948CEB|nr:DNA-binding response regulator [Cupriavidus sp. AU9028]MBY4895853.1 DNA-binding response regulator [Cupriavidus sp. AU9028]